MKCNSSSGAEFHRCYRTVFSHHDGAAVYHDDCTKLSGAKIAAAETLVNPPSEDRLCGHLAPHAYRPSGHLVHERENTPLEALPF